MLILNSIKQFLGVVDSKEEKKSQNYKFYSHLPDLDMFSRLPPKTYVHKNRNGHFIPNGGRYSGVPGVQTVSGLYKGHTSEKFTQDFVAFVQKVIKNLNSDWENTLKSNGKSKDLQEIRSACTAVSRAILGTQNNGGMQGLLQTYAKDPAYPLLKDCIEDLTTRVAEIKGLTESKLGPATAHCPEESFDDEQWQKLIETSSNLKREAVGVKKYIKYKGSLIYNLAMRKLGKWDWWNKVIDGLYLGALPLATQDDLAEIKKAGVGAILSTTEVYENNDSDAVSPQDWKKHGIRHLQLPTPDFETISMDLVERGVEFILWNLKNYRVVYVHCKAGKARSALIIMCYLIKYAGFTADKAYEFILKQRKQAGFNVGSLKWDTLRQFEKMYRN